MVVMVIFPLNIVHCTMEQTRSARWVQGVVPVGHGTHGGTGHRARYMGGGHTASQLLEGLGITPAGWEGPGAQSAMRTCRRVTVVVQGVAPAG